MSSSSSAVPAPETETEVVIATRRIMQAEANVMHCLSVLQAILAKPPTARRDGELDVAKAALEFGQSMVASAEAAYAEAMLRQTKAKSQTAERNIAAAVATNANRPDHECGPSLSIIIPVFYWT
jgi:hypothetical protein